MKTLSSLIAALILLSGCASLSGHAEANKLAEQKQLAAIIAKTGKSQVLITDIPSANNFISDQLIHAYPVDTQGTTCSGYGSSRADESSPA